jgi:uncharacterized membrane protein YfcA
MQSLRATIRSVQRTKTTNAFIRQRRPINNTPPKMPSVTIQTSLPCGAVAGTLGALCGVGGGLVIIPVLKQFSRLTVHQITATSLFSITIASTVGAGSYIAQGKARVPEATLIALSAIVTAGLGAKVSQHLPASSLTKLLALTMMLAVPAVLLKPASQHSLDDGDHQDLSSSSEVDEKTNDVPVMSLLGRGAPSAVSELPAWFKRNWGYSVLGLFVGFSSSLLGIGGGIVMTTYMSVATDLTQHEAVATSLVAMVPTGLSATFWHMRAGNVHTKAALTIGGACAVSMYGAATFIAPHCSEPTMRTIFAVVLSLASLKMLL